MRSFVKIPYLGGEFGMGSGIELKKSAAKCLNATEHSNR